MHIKGRLLHQGSKRSGSGTLNEFFLQLGISLESHKIQCVLSSLPKDFAEQVTLAVPEHLKSDYDAIKACIIDFKKLPRDQQTVQLMSLPIEHSLSPHSTYAPDFAPD